MREASLAVGSDQGPKLCAAATKDHGVVFSVMQAAAQPFNSNQPHRDPRIFSQPMGCLTPPSFYPEIAVSKMKIFSKSVYVVRDPLS